MLRSMMHSLHTLGQFEGVYDGQQVSARLFAYKATAWYTLYVNGDLIGQENTAAEFEKLVSFILGG